jgi:hypothetical protein
VLTRYPRCRFASYCGTREWWDSWKLRWPVNCVSDGKLCEKEVESYQWLSVQLLSSESLTLTNVGRVQVETVVAWLASCSVGTSCTGQYTFYSTKTVLAETHDVDSIDQLTPVLPNVSCVTPADCRTVSSVYCWNFTAGHFTTTDCGGKILLESLSTATRSNAHVMSSESNGTDYKEVSGVHDTHNNVFEN